MGPRHKLGHHRAGRFVDRVDNSLLRRRYAEPPMDVDELEHTHRLLAAHRRRLQELEVKAATLGLNVSPEVTIEIGNIRDQIEQLQNDLAGHTQKQAPVAIPDLPAPVLDESRRFANLATFEQKKDLLIHPFEQAIKND